MSPPELRSGFRESRIGQKSLDGFETLILKENETEQNKILQIKIKIVESVIKLP